MSLLLNFKTNPKAHATFTIEKGTMKEVREVVKEIEALPKSTAVEINVAKMTDKAIGILMYCVALRNINTDIFDVQYTSIIFEQDLPNERLLAAKADFKKVHTQGSGFMKENMETLDWYAILELMQQWVVAKLVDLETINQRLDMESALPKGIKVLDENTFLGELKTSLPDYRQMHTSLLTIYERCFNPITLHFKPYLTWNASPEFQRDLVWNLEKKQLFINSIIEKMPIGAFYVNDADNIFDENDVDNVDGKQGGLLWDGKQRIHALDDFIKNKFPAIINGEMVYYGQAPKVFRHLIEECRATVYMSQYKDEKDLIDAYIRINKSQEKHTQEDFEKALAYLNQLEK